VRQFKRFKGRGQFIDPGLTFFMTCRHYNCLIMMYDLPSRTWVRVFDEFINFSENMKCLVILIKIKYIISVHNFSKSTIFLLYINLIYIISIYD